MPMTIRHMPVAALGAAALSLIVINAPAFAQTAAEPQACVRADPDEYRGETQHVALGRLDEPHRARR